MLHRRNLFVIRNLLGMYAIPLCRVVVAQIYDLGVSPAACHFCLSAFRPPAGSPLSLPGNGWCSSAPSPPVLASRQVRKVISLYHFGSAKHQGEKNKTKSPVSVTATIEKTDDKFLRVASEVKAHISKQFGKHTSKTFLSLKIYSEML